MKTKYARLRVEGLEERWCPSAVPLYWKPTDGNLWSTPANWSTNGDGTAGANSFGFDYV